MQGFDDKIPAREFDNFQVLHFQCKAAAQMFLYMHQASKIYVFTCFQFVNFTAIMSKNITPAEKEAAFALAALMEIPIQYKAARDFGILGQDLLNIFSTGNKFI